MEHNDPAPDKPNAPPPEPGADLDPVELIARALESSNAAAAHGNWVPPEPEELAAMIPQYEIECLIGRGGMGAVYKGRQPALDRLVAIKILPAEVAGDEQFVARFRREAKLLAKLHHPGIVAVYDFGQTRDGQLFFVMEYVDGTDLRSVIKNGGLEPEQALAATAQICEALRVAHEHGVVHRDIKPENVLLTRDGQVKLADFGLSRPAREEETKKFTVTHMVMGSPDYMAPEQKTGEADQRSDIFALGVMLYEMLTGQVPRGAFDPPSRKVGIDVRIDEVVLRALQAEPEKRYQNVTEMKSDVETIYYTPGTAPQETGGSAAQESEKLPAMRKRHRQYLFSAVIALALLGVVAAAVALWHDGSAPATAASSSASGTVKSASAPVSASPVEVVPENSALPKSAYLQSAWTEKFIGLGAKENGATFNYYGPISRGHEENYIFLLVDAGDGYHYLLHSSSGKFIHSNSTSELAEMKLRGPIEPGQEDGYRFKFESNGDGTWRIRHKLSGHCLVAVSPADALPLLAGTSVRETVKDADKFRIISQDDMSNSSDAAEASPLPLLRTPDQPLKLSQRTDLENAAVWVSDQFDDPKKSGFGWGGFEKNFRDGHIVLDGTGAPSIGTSDHQFNDFLCRLVGRTTRGKHNGWGICLLKRLASEIRDPQVEGIDVMINSEGDLTVVPCSWMSARQKKIQTLGPLRITSFRPGEFNALSVILTEGRKLEIFVNDLQACAPVELPFAMEPCWLQIRSMGGASAPARLELESFEVFSMVEKKP